MAIFANEILTSDLLTTWKVARPVNTRAFISSNPEVVPDESLVAASRMIFAVQNLLRKMMRVKTP
jgi:hypothetical protein